jgi:hypothetical protein
MNDERKFRTAAGLRWRGDSWTPNEFWELALANSWWVGSRRRMSTRGPWTLSPE